MLSSEQRLELQFCAGDKEGWGPWSSSRDFDFTNCFQNGFIKVAPFAVLFFIGIPRLILLLWIQKRPAIYSEQKLWSVNTSKIIFASFLASLSFCTLASQISSSALFLVIPSTISTVGYIFATCLHNIENSRSHIGSTSLLFFWLANIVASGILLRSTLIQGEYSTDPYLLISQVLSFTFSIVVFILENIPKSRLGYISLDERHEAPEDTANIFSRLSFHWMDPLMKLGHAQELEMNSLWNLTKRLTATENSKIFQSAWKKQLEREHPSFVWALIRAFGPVFFSAAIFKIGQDALGFTQPQLLKQMMTFASSYSATSPTPHVPVSHGLAIAFCMLGAAILQTIMLHQYFHICLVTGMRARSAIVTAVYRKSLRLSNAARQASTVGEITNLMAVDASRVADLTTYFHILWSGPFQIFLAVYFLYQALGVAVFGGVAVMILMVPINAFLAVKSRKLNKEQMGNKDNRTRLVDEFLNGIKVIKLYAWENPFLKRISEIREMELSTLKKIGYLATFQTFTWSCTPFLVSFTSFGIYSLLSPEPLTSTKVFVSLSLFNLLQFPLTVFPNVITAVVEASVSFSRLAKFLLAEELDMDAVKYDLMRHSDSQGPIERVLVKNGSFKWDIDGSPVIKDVSLTASDKELVAVVGSVGAGKSSLLSAILGETYRVDGSVTVRGTVAYVPQNAWIMNASLRDNILFGRPYEEEFYQNTIKACGLVPDLEILPGGDAIEIGERGINLSGGQKQRVSIARAVYSQAEIYLFDDPLSAVDAHVGRSIFDNVFGKKGLLKDKARIFVTHGIHFLPEADKIVVMTDGSVSENGTYQDLIRAQGTFQKLIKEFGKQKIVDTRSRQTSGESVTSSSDSKDAIREEGESIAKDKSVKTKESSSEEDKSGLIAKEEAAKGSVSLSVYSSYAKACGFPNVMAALSLCILAQGLSVFQNVFLSWWAHENDQAKHVQMHLNALALNPNYSLPSAVQSVTDSSNEHSPFWWLLIYGSIGLAYSAAVMIQVIFVWILCGIPASRKLHQSLLNNVARLPQSFFDTTPLGRVMNRFSKDQYTIDEVLPRSFHSYIRTLFVVVSVLGVNALGSPLYIILALPLLGLYAYFQKFYLRSSRALKRLDSISRSPIFAHFQESLNGVSTIRAYRREGTFIDANQDKLDFNQRAYYPSVSSNRWLAVRLEFIGALIVFGSAMVGVSSIYFKINLSSAVIGLMLTYSLTVTQTLNWMVRQSCEIETNIVSVERIKEYIEWPTEAPFHLPDSRVDPGWPKQGKIEFHGYSTRYRQGLDLVLKDLDLALRPHEKIGIVGRTGAGKSSLTLALFRLIEPANGTILIDDRDVTQLGLHDLRSRLTIIPQDPVLFTGPIRYNLDPFARHSDAELWSALEAASLKAHISGLEGGLDAPVLQNGENFSVGQRQLICLARALLRKTSILVLDEATAAIDVETDNIIQQTIRKEFSDCTILTIAHRINTVMDNDRILVLDQGRVCEFDSPTNLLADRSSRFFSLAKEAGQAH